MQSEKPGLIYVYNAIDAASRDFLTNIEAIEKTMNGSIAINRIDTYKSNGLALKLDLEKIPAIVITKEGKITDKIYELNQEMIASKF